jgi:hypothetical protein
MQHLLETEKPPIKHTPNASFTRRERNWIGCGRDTFAHHYHFGQRSLVLALGVKALLARTLLMLR